ncbi:hypothetical protein ACGF3G_37835 [Streptomyces sp. NPDC048179]|uniref:hypothetical protein n=1 Tax=Streptomyces sp. NPDC048179 TaxID=3365506 RepID=UPI00372224F3
MVGFTVTAPTATHRNVRVIRDACFPLAYALSAAAVGKPTSTVMREVAGGHAVVTVVLAEYGGGAAQAALDALATALDECVGGFTATVDGEGRAFSRLVPELAPEGADQAMAWGAVVERDGVKSPVKTVVFRKGATVGYLTAVPKGSAPKDFSVPDAVVDAQLAKLS